MRKPDNPSRKHLREIGLQKRTLLAELCGCSINTLNSIAWYGRDPSRKLAAKMELATDGKIRAFDFERDAMEAAKSILQR